MTIMSSSNKCNPAFKMWSSLLIFALFFTFIHSSTLGLQCEYYNATECRGAAEESCMKTISCGKDESSKFHSCYSIWQIKNQKKTLEYKGCFQNNKDCLGKDTCVDTTHGNIGKNSNTTTLYCCCIKDFCNQDYFWKPAPTTTTVKPILLPQSRTGSSSIIIFVLVPLAFGLFILGAIFAHKHMNKKGLPESATHDEENSLLDKPSSDVASVELKELIASGRFGKVWKATMKGQPSFVAVKILPRREKVSWKLEQEVYSLKMMSESNYIVKFLGAKCAPDGELWLISEYIEEKSLYEYLKSKLLNWNEVLTVAITMCQGLAFLHEEIYYGEEKGYKPAVAHRDFKSKNVLIRSDKTACIADFGLAQIFYPDKPVGTSHGQVGTRRYMAPEVLEGAVSFTRDSFQRIDMYACGLVLWELASRCTAQQGPVNEYMLPFEEYCAQQPSLEQMQDIVVTQRKRPTIRNNWLSHPGMCVMAEAMKEAWDQDAEARISASCIVERLRAVNNKCIV